MAEGLILNKVAAPGTPAANKADVYMDTVDNRVKVVDYNGVISILSEKYVDNVITNGSFRIQQRVAAASTLIPAVANSTRAGQVSDRWAVTASVTTNLNWQQVDTSGAPETGLLARYYGSIISSSAGKKVMFSQFILHSDMAHLRGQKVRLSCKLLQKVGSAGQTYKLGLLQLTSAGTVDVCPAFLTGAWSAVTGTDPAWGTNLSPITPDASPVGENGTITGNFLNILGSAAWVRSSCVFTVPSNCKNLVVVLFADATGGTTDNLSLAEFQLTPGSEISDFWDAPLADDLYRCQRFFCKSFPQTVVPAASVSEATGGSGITGLIGKAGATALAAQISIQYPVVMWKVPTITLFTPTAAGAQAWRFSGAAAAVQTATAARASSTTDRGVVITATGDAAGAVGDLVGVHYTAEAEFIT